MPTRSSSRNLGGNYFNIPYRYNQQQGGLRLPIVPNALKIMEDAFNIDSLIEARKRKEEQYVIDLKNLPHSPEVSKLPKGTEPMVTEEFVRLKNIYNEGSIMMRDAAEGTERWHQGREMKHKAETAINNMDATFTNLQQARASYLENITQDLYSDANLPGEVDNAIDTWNQLMDGTIDPSRLYFEGGTLRVKGGGSNFILDSDGNKVHSDIGVDELKGRFLEDNKTMSDMTTLQTTEYQNAVSTGNRFNARFMVPRIANILNNANKQNMASMGYDWVFSIGNEDGTEQIFKFADSKAAIFWSSNACREDGVCGFGNDQWIRDSARTSTLSDPEARDAENKKFGEYADRLKLELQKYITDIMRTSINEGADRFVPSGSGRGFVFEEKARARKDAYRQVVKDAQSIINTSEVYKDEANRTGEQYSKDFIQEIVNQIAGYSDHGVSVNTPKEAKSIFWNMDESKSKLVSRLSGMKENDANWGFAVFTGFLKGKEGKDGGDYFLKNFVHTVGGDKKPNDQWETNITTALKLLTNNKVQPVSIKKVISKIKKMKKDKYITQHGNWGGVDDAKAAKQELKELIRDVIFDSSIKGGTSGDPNELIITKTKSQGGNVIMDMMGINTWDAANPFSDLFINRMAGTELIGDVAVQEMLGVDFNSGEFDKL